MRNILTALLLLSSHVFGGEWVVTEGGLSPNKKLAVAVFSQKTEFIDEADDTVLLIDQSKGHRIGPLEEVSSSGGTWGNTTKNVRCVWSADSSILIVNYRTGRLMHSSQIYQIKGRRAVPLPLPDAKTHPKGKILEAVGYSANPGSEITLSKDGTILVTAWGFTPKEGQDYSKYGLPAFEGGTLCFHYRFNQNGHLVLADVTAPAEQ
ncbi:hypothetical protein BH11VER1_BH11VER1_32890 [soil metagenome]